MRAKMISNKTFGHTFLPLINSFGFWQILGFHSIKSIAKNQKEFSRGKRVSPKVSKVSTTKVRIFKGFSNIVQFWVLSLCLSSFAWSVTNDSNENLFLSSPLQFALSPNEDEKLPSSFVSLFHWKQKNSKAGRKVYLEYKNRFLGS